MTTTQPTGEQAATWLPIGDLTPWADNPRENDHAVPEVARSIERFGFGAPILARPVDGGGLEVIAGHTRLKAAESLGLDRVPVRVLDLDPTDARLLALADNRLGELAEWSSGLEDVLRQMGNDGVDLDGLGWSAEELADLLTPTFDPDGTEDDIPAIGEVADSVVGEVYELGPHRLACGDCTAADIETYREHHLITDPPYGIGISANPVRQAHDRTYWDSAPASDELLIKFVRLCPSAIIWGGNYFGLPPSQTFFIWDKKQPEQFTLAMCEMAWSNVGGPAKLYRRSVVGYSKDHPTQKPVDLIVWCLSWIGDGPVFDPFAGSGTTLIACAMTGRRARLIELDPRYCDVIRRRWTTWADKNGQDPGPGALE